MRRHVFNKTITDYYSFINVVIVITKSTDSDDFREFVSEIYHIHKLDCIVIDEAQKLLINTSYHHEIAEVRSLNFSVQFVFLSTTFSSQFGKLYEKHMLIEEFKYIRNFIYKRNVRYAMKIMKNNDLQSFTL